MQATLMHLPSLIFVLPLFQQDGKGSISKQAEAIVCTVKKYTYEHISIRTLIY